MLQLILGIAGTGKTTRLLQGMEQRAQAQKKSILLVPEQFSSSAEEMVYATFGDALSAYVEVASFRTLGERILKACGGVNQRVLTDAGRAVFVRRALDALGSEANTFARHRHNTAFCAMCADTIAELKTAGATPDILAHVAGVAGEPKLSELALIFEAYEAGLRQTAMDPQDQLELAAGRADCGYFAGKTCFIDNFDGFTAPEYSLLERLLAHCEAVEVALCCDSLAETDGGLGRFSPVRRTAQQLQRLAAKAGRRTAAPQLLQTPMRCSVEGPAAVNRLLALGTVQAAPAPPGLTLTECVDEWEEVRLVAAEMHRLAKQGVSFSKMALICRDISRYEASARRAFGLFNIPFFVDAPATIENTAPVSFIRAALRLLREGMVSGPILALLKTGLWKYTKSDISALENYVYTWNPRAADWAAPFTRNPAGLMAEMNETAAGQLAAAEGLRAELVPVLKKFADACRGQNVAEVSRRIYQLLQQAGAAENDEKIKEALAADAPGLAQEGQRAWDVAMDLLDQMVLLVGAEMLPPVEYDELFLLLVRSTDFGGLPQTLECVMFTSADRMRLANPDYCFVVGICEGEFPMQVGYSGLLTHTDRELLVKEGRIEMPGSFENRVLLEEMFFYRALTTARKGLHLSWPARLGGSAKMPAAALQPLQTVLQPPPLQVPAEDAAGTPEAALDRLGSVYRENTPEAASLYQALGQSPATRAKLEKLRAVQNDGDFFVRDAAVVRGLVGERLTLSATRTDTYYKCRFAYFMERVLRVKPRPKAELSPLESGTFVHYILEQVLAQAGGAFASLQDAQIEQMTRLCAEAFIQKNLPVETRRTAALLEGIIRNTTDLLYFLRDDAAQSDFVVDAAELPIGEGPGEIPPLELETPEGRKIRVSGQIDRVDVLRKGGKSYLRVVDYKTGSKQFSLEDVYCGLNMQMLIYLDTLCKNGQQRYPGAVPAAVLYLAGDPAPTSGDRQDNAGPVYKLDGLVLEDEEILRAMDKDGEGIFLPVKHREGKPLRAGSKLANFEKWGNIMRRVEALVAGMAQGVYSGSFAARPVLNRDKRRPCEYCPYRAACRHEDGMNERPVFAPENAFAQEQEGQDG